MTTTYVLTVYTLVALGFWAHALGVMRLRARSRRREPLFAIGERLFLGLFALVASLAWPLLLPLQLIGMAQTASLRWGSRMWGQLGERRRTAVIGRA